MDGIVRHLLILNDHLCQARGGFLGTHCRRVGEFSAILAETLGLPRREVKEWKLAGRFHDVGKIWADLTGPLMKPGRLNAEERLMMESPPIRAMRWWWPSLGC